MKSGIISIYKESGYTSHDVVAKMRGILGQKKIGHTGTLDPAAEGVLPVCLGKATKVCDLLTDQNKTYRTRMLLGTRTDTQDLTGTVLEERPATCSEKEVVSAIQSFLGEYDQVPPMYSALKVNGKKLCDLARAGKEVERKARRVLIHSIEIEEVNLPYVTMTVSCSKGTYIRTLCEDIGARLGCGACMATLLRTQAGPFSLAQSIRLGELETLVQQNRLDEVLIPVDRMFQQYPAVTAPEALQKAIENGNRILAEDLGMAQGADTIRLYDANGTFAGIYCYMPEQNDYKLRKLFWD